MFARSIAVGFAIVLGAAPASAQQRGTIEFGAFGSASSFDKSLNLDNGFGGGGRLGVFLAPRWSMEFEAGAMRAERALGLRSVRVAPISGRLTFIPVAFNRLSLLVGAGISNTDYQFLNNYGFSALLGTRLPIAPSLALRFDGIGDFASHDRTNLGVRAGLSFFRHPSLTRTMQVTSIAPVRVRPDSVNATEQGRLRSTDAKYWALRDSLARPVLRMKNLPSSAAARETMQALIHFAHDRSELSDSAKIILDEKVAIFRSNPAIRIVIVGHASESGTDAYNYALGTRRAEAAKAYLVAQGVDQDRIEIGTKGEGQLLVEGPGEPAAAENRRDQFRLLIGFDYLVTPKP